MEFHNVSWLRANAAQLCDLGNPRCRLRYTVRRPHQNRRCRGFRTRPPPRSECRSYPLGSCELGRHTPVSPCHRTAALQTTDTRVNDDTSKHCLQGEYGEQHLAKRATLPPQTVTLYYYLNKHIKTSSLAAVFHPLEDQLQ